MSMLRKLEAACRAVFAWEAVEIDKAYRGTVILQRNSVTGCHRWCHKTNPRSVPDEWKIGLPPLSVTHPMPPSGGSSGVKPAPDRPLHIGTDLGRDAGDATSYAFLGCKTSDQASSERRQDLLKRIREAMPQGLLEAGEPVFTPPRIFALEPMARGGFVVSASGCKTFAGSLTDCLNFIEAELTEEAA
jgi:hypothetical protein